MTDPYDPSIGLKAIKATADIITVSHDHYDHNNTSAVKGTKRRKEPFIVAGPGEYEISGVSIFGLSSFHDQKGGKERGRNTIYFINLDDLKLVHLGDLGHKLNDEQLEEINSPDLLFIPVGGTYTLDASLAVEVIGQIDPKIVIPMHYQLPGLTIKLAPVDDFLKEMGVEKIKPVAKLVISKDKLPEEREVVVLNVRC